MKAIFVARLIELRRLQRDYAGCTIYAACSADVQFDPRICPADNDFVPAESICNV